MPKGSCLCGAVTFEVAGSLNPPDACHCSRCRKHSGHYFASTDIPKAALTVQGEDFVQWYQSSDKARRGFCRQCGSSLFWDPLFEEWMGVSMGAFDESTGTFLKHHIFVADKGDYYDIADGLPQNPH